jgi:hypothetical protein
MNGCETFQPKNIQHFCRNDLFLKSRISNRTIFKSVSIRTAYFSKNVMSCIFFVKKLRVHFILTILINFKTNLENIRFFFNFD